MTTAHGPGRIDEVENRRRLDALARGALPGTATAVLMVLAAAPVGLPSAVMAATRL